MQHATFIDKMAAYRPIYEFALKRGGQKPSHKEIATKFDILPCVAATAVRFYDNHKSDPQRPEYGTMTHSSVMAAHTLLNLSDLAGMRKRLIAHFSSSIGCSKPYPRFISKQLLRKILTGSGLEWFEKDGKPWVHWKHDKEIA